MWENMKQIWIPIRGVTGTRFSGTRSPVPGWGQFLLVRIVQWNLLLATSALLNQRHGSACHRHISPSWICVQADRRICGCTHLHLKENLEAPSCNGIGPREWWMSPGGGQLHGLALSGSQGSKFGSNDNEVTLSVLRMPNLHYRFFVTPGFQTFLACNDRYTKSVSLVQIVSANRSLNPIFN